MPKRTSTRRVETVRAISPRAGHFGLIVEEGFDARVLQTLAALFEHPFCERNSQQTQTNQREGAGLRRGYLRQCYAVKQHERRDTGDVAGGQEAERLIHRFRREGQCLQPAAGPGEIAVVGDEHVRGIVRFREAAPSQSDVPAIVHSSQGRKAVLLRAGLIETDLILCANDESRQILVEGTAIGRVAIHREVVAAIGAGARIYPEREATAELRTAK